MYNKLLLAAKGRTQKWI